MGLTAADGLSSIEEFSGNKDGNISHQIRAGRIFAYERGRKGAGSAMQSALLLFVYSSFSQDESYLHEMAQPLVNNMIAVLPDILADTFYQHDILALFYHCVLL